MPVDEKERFRSFAERYVIERAGRFAPDTVQADAWSAIHEAVTVYKMIDQQGDLIVKQLQERRDHAMQAALEGKNEAMSAGVSSSGPIPGQQTPQQALNAAPLPRRPPPIPATLTPAELISHISSLPIAMAEKAKLFQDVVDRDAIMKGPYHGTPPNIRAKAK